MALIGRIGSGKSTIQKLILGLYQPAEGAVLLDGIDLRQLDPADVRRNCGYVSQDVTLFYGTLRENIALRPAARRRRGRARGGRASPACRSSSTAIRRASTSPWASAANRCPAASARASAWRARVLHNAPLLLLDEPTSAMDFSTEAQITQRIGEYAQHKTVVLVTHRTSLLSMVTRVIVIDGGKIVADGPRDRIMEALQSGRIAHAA